MRSGYGELHGNPQQLSRAGWLSPGMIGLSRRRGEKEMKPAIRRLFNEENLFLHMEKSHLCLSSATPLAVLSSAPVGGGRGCWRKLVNRHVDKDYRESDPVGETRRWLVENGYDPEQTPTLLTAARVEDASVIKVGDPLVQVAAIVTAGVGNAARMGFPGPVFTDCPDQGTINIILVVDGELTEAAMVNTVITVTEAKAAALQELDVKDGEGRSATGTTTDAVMIASTQRKRGKYVHAYAGAASPLGQAVGQAVREAVREAVLRERRRR
ncbi:adenosylcobinamide amidohydrolase [Kroppenstedtia eburnea]|uniref:Iron complex transport system ATP-binding protein n=1 Tax=Kroppenstedtia eburnea TaxID=714067 RepID=A0A1N7NVV7_9BACL|nr:adenosylcobinamide amidohydrolase [Kroppenstedtia eburnea]QKI81189.1 adenosylcobinamide amidohydrolase [Kroppenstedtia eburnea]SIT02457.1 iron complex transport system ATP-binding protein [Kroppenstedtia eburnea]